MAKITIDFQNGRTVEMEPEPGPGNDYHTVKWHPAGSCIEAAAELRKPADMLWPAPSPAPAAETPANHGMDSH